MYHGRDGHIRVEEIERPEAATGEVRVRVSVSGVNPTDWKTRRQPRLPDDWAFKLVDQDGGTLGKVVIDV